VEARVSDQSAGGVLIRTPIGGARGHEIQINSTHPMPNKTGSLQLVETDRSTTLLGVKAAPVPFGEWFTMDIIAEGNRVTVKVNGKTTADAIDVGDAFPLGCIALRHVANSTIEFRRVEIKLLPSR
jgi:hypothetical protein